jgi:hypothetical protein
MPRSLRLLTCCSLWLAGMLILAGPGVHLFAPCDHEDHHAPGNPAGEDDSCPICSLHSQPELPVPLASIDRPTPVVAQVEEPGHVLAGRSAAPSRLPRAPPIG